MRVNREIRASQVRVISQTGEQIGVVTIQEALKRAEEEGLDLVEIVPGATPPVCKIIDYGKYRYDQTKRERPEKELKTAETNNVRRDVQQGHPFCIAPSHRRNCNTIVTFSSILFTQL